MEFFTSDFISGLISIILIDLVLGGDNAILIALATRKLPQEHRKKAIFWGVLGAIIVRAGLTVIAIYILNIPLIKFIGGVLLIWIAYKLLVDNSKPEEINSGKNVTDAIKTIIFADLLMGIDNILAIAGAARGDVLLVVTGLLISIPIIVWGSSIILRFIDRFPIIIFIGSGVIAYTAGKMIVEDIWMHDNVFSGLPGSELIVPLTITGLVLILGYFKRSKRKD